MDENIDMLDAYSCIIFDFDGVLVESNLLKTRCFYSIWGDDSHGREEFISAVLKTPGDRYSFIQTLYDQFSKGHALPHDCQYYIEQYSMLVKRGILEMGLKKEASALLEAYKDTCMLINSATPETELVPIVRSLGLDRYITEAKGRPMTKEQIFTYFLDTYSFDKQDMVFLGDAKSDEEAARSFGIDFIPVRSQGGDFQSF